MKLKKIIFSFLFQMSRRRRGGRNQGNDDDNGFAERGGYMAAKKQKLEEQFSKVIPYLDEKRSSLF